MKSKQWLLLIIIGLLCVGGVVYAGVNEGDRENMPDTHRTGWDVKHQQYAKGNEAECAMCHKPFFCIDCHQRRDDVTERVHKRNWKFFHSVQARANPKKCDSCHKTSFCTDCHRNPE